MTMAGVAVPAAASSTLPRHAPHSKHAIRTFKGPVVGMQWGPVQVTVVLRSGKIINVKATAPHHTSRSTLINSVAVPILKSEVLKAQSAKINTVSGATLTSKAYIQSLKGALKLAHH
jgi:uncharacterized protein with FMN-binding domain